MIGVFGSDLSDFPEKQTYSEVHSGRIQRHKIHKIKEDLEIQVRFQNFPLPCHVSIALWANKCHFAKIGLKIVASVLNLSPLRKCN